MNVVVHLRPMRDPASFAVQSKAHKIVIHRDEYVANPADRHALEAALQLAGAEDSVTAVALGGEPAEDLLRDARAKGACRALRVEYPALPSADAGVVTCLLQHVVERIGAVDLVLLGAEVVDADMAQVGPRLAEALGWPFLGAAHRLERDTVGVPGTAGLRVIAPGPRTQAFHSYQVSLPAVVTVAPNSNVPRYAPAPGIMSIYRDPGAVEVLTAAGLGMSGDSLAPAVVLRGHSFPPERGHERRVEGGVEEVAQQLGDLLKLYTNQGGIRRVRTTDQTSTSELTGAGRQPAVWVVLPDSDSAALLGNARRLADSVGAGVCALVADESLAGQAVARGADRVEVTPDAVSHLAGQQPEFVLFPQSHGADAARLAQRLGAGLVTNAHGLKVEPASSRTAFGSRSIPPGRVLHASYPVYRGDYFLDFVVTSPVKIATLDPRRLPAPNGDAVRLDPAPALPISLEHRGGPGWPHGVHDLGPVAYEPVAWRPLSKARVIVAVGRGVRDAEGLEMARALAQKLGAELAGDRSARDSGWIDDEHLVDVTGQEVAPDLYLALGILGDTMHNAAIAGARQVIAVHSNPDAPIFQAADLAVVQEPKTTLARLLAARP